MKREQTNSQSDDDSDYKRDKRRRKKSRWGDDPPVDIKPPGITVPPPLPGLNFNIEKKLKQSLIQ